MQAHTVRVSYLNDTIFGSEETIILYSFSAIEQATMQVLPMKINVKDDIKQDNDVKNSGHRPSS